jgi:hypothetical protein
MVQQRELLINHYIGSTTRDPLELSNHFDAVTQLLIDLQTFVYGRIPLAAYPAHYHSTLQLAQLAETLRSIEEGFPRQLHVIPERRTRRHQIDEEALRELMRANLTDIDTAGLLTCLHAARGRSPGPSMRRNCIARQGLTIRSMRPFKRYVFGTK